MLRNSDRRYKHASEVLLNSVHEDGRIYHSKEPYVAITISPFHKSFRSQIEDGIWAIVNCLNKKGYYTLSSCEGHGLKDNCFVMFVFRDKAIKDTFVEGASKIKGITVRDAEYDIEFLRSLFNINYDEFTEKALRFEKEENDSIPVDELNFLFNSNASNYWIIQLRINRLPSKNIRFFDMLFFKNYFTKNKLLKFIESQPFHV